jgi:tuftelin-interacting protein 11
LPLLTLYFFLATFPPRRGDEIAPEPEKPKGRAGTNKKGNRAADAGDSDAAGGSRTKEQPWRNRTKKTKIRVEHKTYDQIVAEAGEPGHAGGVGMIIDATGATVSCFPSKLTC